MRLMTCLGAMILVFMLLAPAQAGTVFQFDPNDLIDLYPASAGTSDTTGQNKATQPNARRVHEQWASSWYETFYNPASPQTQPDSYNTYVNWRNGLGDGEGISAFNIWLLDNPAARSWGEETVWDPDGAKPTGAADASGNWNVEVIANPWGAGWLVQWWTEDPDYYLRPGGADIGEFSFAGTAYHDTNGNGFDSTDPEVQIGDVVRVWFGTANWTEWDDDTQQWIHEWGVHFDNTGWGQLTPAATPFSAGLVDSAGYGSGYEGVLDITAVPLPGAGWTGMILLGGLGLLGAVRRRFFLR